MAETVSQIVYRSDPVVDERATSESDQNFSINTLQVQDQVSQTVKFRFTHCGVKVRNSGFGLLALGRSDTNMNTTSAESIDLEKNKSDDGWKAILKDVSEEICSGSLLAIMGPSGSGKSTLLSLLALTPNNGKGTGNVTLNGHKIDSAILRQYCAFMPQDDHLWPFLTCRETLSFAADFFLSKSSAERSAEVDRLIRELGLEKCANTLCGNQFLKGLSGGQKRRLSLAIALMKQPVVLFLDEPTSGLDSASAASFVAFLKYYAQQHGVAVVCTIHQPSTAIFTRFDGTILLSNGRVAYSGPTCDLARYFKEDVGSTAPPDYSLAEFVLEAVNSDFGDEQKRLQVDSLLNAWAACSGPDGPNCLRPEAPREPLPDRSSTSTSLPTQVRLTGEIRQHPHSHCTSIAALPRQQRCPSPVRTRRSRAGGGS
jgi:ABC-type multidrug transport system ATPase subunit